MEFLIFEKLSEVSRDWFAKRSRYRDAGGDLPLEQIERRFSKTKNGIHYAII